MKRTLQLYSRWAIACLCLNLLPALALAGSTLLIFQGSGQLQTLVTTITVSQPQAFTLQWINQQAGATAGTWVVTKAGAGNTTLATGEVTAPPPGHPTTFSIPANAFLLASPPPSPVTFNISITTHNASMQPLGGAPPAAVVIQGPAAPPQTLNFGPYAVYPTVTLVTYNEKIGEVPNTELHYAGADVTVLAKNNATVPTTLSSLTLLDNNVLLRQASPVSVPALKPGASTTLNVHLDAVLPPPQSQLPENLQYSQWYQQYQTLCGPSLFTLLAWIGPQSQAPPNDSINIALAPNTPICANGQCALPCQVGSNIQTALDGHVVGYSYFVGLYPRFDPSGFGAGGLARTIADGTPVPFSPTTKITVASVSKLVTAIAAIRILAENKVSLDAAIGPYLPSDWKVSPYVQGITFAQLMSQHSGIKDYGNVTNDYATLQKFYSQPVAAPSKNPPSSPPATTPCDPKDANGNLIPAPYGEGIIAGNNDYCYSNFNFSIMRILLPKVAKFKEDPNQSTRPQTLANQYVQLVQQNEFNLVGQNGVQCAPPGGSSYSFVYKNPAGGNGFDWGDVSLSCGAAGWYLSAEDIGRVLLSINAMDGRIFTENASVDMLGELRARGLGVDVDSSGELEKNGGWSANCDSNGKNCADVKTSVAIFGPATGPRMVGVLFLNSDIFGGPANGGNAQSVLEKAYTDALKPGQ
jgi:CubicO group peptidase (beta-lactamase class C family)